jgi:hypothetical protein
MLITLHYSGAGGSPRRHNSMDEMFGLVATLTLNGQRQRSLSDSGASNKDTCTNGKCKYEFTANCQSKYNN